VKCRVWGGVSVGRGKAEAGSPGKEQKDGDDEEQANDVPISTEEPQDKAQEGDAFGTTEGSDNSSAPSGESGWILGVCAELLRRGRNEDRTEKNSSADGGRCDKNKDRYEQRRHRLQTLRKLEKHHTVEHGGCKKGHLNQPGEPQGAFSRAQGSSIQTGVPALF
jgi:hypothetical protein